MTGSTMSDGPSGFGGRWRKAARDFMEQLLPGPHLLLGQEPVMLRYDKSLPPADVILDPDAQQKLAPTWNQPPPDFSEIWVLLSEPEGDDGSQIEVSINEHRLGILTTADSTDFRPILASARADGKPLADVAIRDRDASGGWALHVYRPERH